MPLGEHLRANQDIHFIRMNLLAMIRQARLLRVVTVYAQNTSFWKTFPQHAFDPRVPLPTG